MIRLGLLIIVAMGCSTPTRHDDRAVLDSLRNATTIMGWEPEQQRVGYRNIEKLVRTGVIRHGERVFPLPEALRDFSSFRYSFKDKPRTLDDFMSDLNVAGLLVVVDGKIVLERYAHGNTRESKWTSFSVAKSIVSLLFGAALRDGSIKSLDDSVVKYVPELAGTEYDAVSIRHLLQMSSGVQWNEDPIVDITQMTKLHHEGGFPAQVAYMRKLPRAAAPGKLFHYVNAEADLAGAVLRAATGRELSEYLSATIWQPFGMEADGYWIKMPRSELELGGCCISATLRDYGRIGLFALRDGIAPDGTRLLPDGWISESVRPSPASKTYGYYWWLHDNGAFSADGAYGQHIRVMPTQRIVIAIQSYWPEAVTDELLGHTDAFVDALAGFAR